MLLCDVVGEYDPRRNGGWSSLRIGHRHPLISAYDESRLDNLIRRRNRTLGAG